MEYLLGGKNHFDWGRIGSDLVMENHIKSFQVGFAMVGWCILLKSDFQPLYSHSNTFLALIS